MLIYLYLSVMTSGLARRTTSHQLKLYLLMLYEMRDKCESAALMLSLYLKVLTILSERARPAQSPRDPEASSNVNSQRLQWHENNWLSSGDPLDFFQLPFGTLRFVAFALVRIKTANASQSVSR